MAHLAPVKHKRRVATPQTHCLINLIVGVHSVRRFAIMAATCM